MKTTEYDLKDKIILSIFVFLEDGNKSHLEKAKENLNLYASERREFLKKVSKKDLKQSFIDFIDSGRPMNERINNLYSAI